MDNKFFQNKGKFNFLWIIPKENHGMFRLFNWRDKKRINTQKKYFGEHNRIKNKSNCIFA